MMLRNCFVREEEDHLVIGSGILPEWLAAGEVLSFGPTFTAWGPVSVRVQSSRLFLEGAWRDQPPRIRIAVPGHAAFDAAPGEHSFLLVPS